MTSEPSHPGKRTRVDPLDGAMALFLMLATACLMYLSCQDTAFAVDQNNYLGGAEAIAEGHGYRESFVVGMPRCTIYPPAFSTYIAVFWRWGGDFPANLASLLAGQWLLGGLSAGLIYLLLRQQGMAARWAFLAALLFGSSNCWHIMANGFFSESLMQPLTLALLLALGNRRPHGLGFASMIGILLAVLFLTRSASTAIVGGALLCALLHVRRLGWAKLIAVALPSVAAVLAWKIWTAGGSKTYASTFIEIVRDVLGPMGYLGRVGSNLLSVITGRDVIAAASPFWSRLPYLPAVTGAGLGWVVHVSLGVGGALLMGVALVGLWHRRARGDLWIAAVAALYLLQNILWWYWLGDRGMLVLLPLLILWIHAGARFLADRWQVVTPMRVAALGLLFLAILCNVGLTLRAPRTRSRSPHSERAQIEEVGQWMRQHASERDVIVATGDIPLAHFTHASGRKVVGVAGSQVPVVPQVDPTLAVVRMHPNQYMPQPERLGETLFTSTDGAFAIRRVAMGNP